NDRSTLGLVSQRGNLCQILHLPVQLDIIIAGLGTENGTTTLVQRVTQVTLTAAARSLLTVKLLARTLHFQPGLHLVRTLTLRGQVLLDGQVDHMIIRLNPKDLFGQLYRPACLLSFYI